MIKTKLAIVVLLAGLCSCGEEGSGNLTVAGGVVSSSSAVYENLNLQSMIEPLAGASDVGILSDSSINPTAFMMRIYAVGFSTKTDCTDMTVINITDNPESENWIESPTLTSTNMKDGTYPCVAFEMDPALTITPEESSDTGNCVANQSFTQNVGSGDTTLLTTGETGAIEGRMAVYISTTGSTGDSCGQGCAATPEMPAYLESPLVVEGNKSGQFTVDALGSLSDSNGSCDMDIPSWSFQ